MLVILALQISTNSSSREKIDVRSIKSELETIWGSINNLRSIRIANSTAIKQVNKANDLLRDKQKAILDNITNIFEIINETNDKEAEEEWVIVMKNN